MPSPRGLYVGMTLAELQAEKLIALDRVRNGDRTSLSGLGQSSGRTFTMSADEHLREVNFAIDRLSGTTIRATHFAPGR